MRQFIFSVLACGVAVGLYFILRPYFGVETLSWMCILGAAPFAMLGFVTYHGMTAEQFIWAWLRSEMLEPKEFKFEDSNYYYAALKDTIEGCKPGVPSNGSPKNRSIFTNGRRPSMIKTIKTMSQAGKGAIHRPTEGAGCDPRPPYLAGRHFF